MPSVSAKLRPRIAIFKNDHVGFSCLESGPGVTFTKWTMASITGRILTQRAHPTPKHQLSTSRSPC